MKIMIRPDKILYDIAVKNLEAHSNRNRKTAIMFGLCIAFLVFAGSTFELIGNLLFS
jgi:hypothetical protein